MNLHAVAMPKTCVPTSSVCCRAIVSVVGSSHFSENTPLILRGEGQTIN